MTICGIPVERIADWNAPYLHRGRLVRTARPTRLYHVLARKVPRRLQQAGIFYRKEGSVTWLVQYLAAVPAEERPVTPAVMPDLPLQKVRINEAGLLSWQPDPVRRLKRFWQQGERWLLDASDTGTGKTYVALALARELGKTVRVVTVKAAKAQWLEAAASLGVRCEAVNYEALKTGKHPWVRWDSRDWPVWQADRKNSLLVFDEAQACKAVDWTLNSKLLMMARHQGVPALLVSATLATSPVNLRAAGYALGLHGLADFTDWLRAHGCFPVGSDWMFGNDAAVMKELHLELFNRCAVRVRKADLKGVFPDTVIEALLVEFPDRIAAIYRELQDAWERFKKRAADYAPGPFTDLVAARQEVELLKVPELVRQAQDGLEEGMSVALFFNFDASLEAAADLLKCRCLVRGGQKEADRRAAQLAFQADRERVICCNVESGGVALSLHGPRERLALINPTFKADSLRQVLGRVQRAGGSPSVQRILFAAGTVEEDICRNVRAKLDNLDRLNDGDTAGNLFLEKA